MMENQDRPLVAYRLSLPPSEPDPATTITGAIKNRVTELIDSVRQGIAGSKKKPQTPTTLKVAGYNLILMSQEGDVVWAKEYSGDVFEFGPRNSLWVFCEFTNHTKVEKEIAEYEIELVGEDGAVVKRFNKWFDESVVVAPHQSKTFLGQWRL